MFGSQRPLFLRPGHEHVDRGAHALAHLPLALGARARCPASPRAVPRSERLDLAHLPTAPRVSPKPRVRFLRGLAHVPVDGLDHVLEQGVDQLFLVSEVPVDRADPQARRGARRR